MPPKITLIVATDKNSAIGQNGALPWHLPADMAHFKSRTMGLPIIMGRLTWESIGRPLPGRQNIVISSMLTADDLPGATLVNTVEEAMNAAASADEVMVIGGGRIYQSVLDRADEIELTQIDAEFEADTWFPALDPGTWRVVAEKSHDADEKNRWPYRFLTYRRINGSLVEV